MRTKLSDRTLPEYSKTEEYFHVISHMVGACFGLVVFILCIARTAHTAKPVSMIACLIYGISQVLLYTLSSLYHGLKHQMTKKVFQILDHCVIYLFIAGTYTPVALIPLRQHNEALGWIVFAVEWILAFLLVTLTAIDLKRFRVISMAGYLVMGWGVVVIADQTITAMTMNGFLLLLLGGVFYTVGAILYGLGRKQKYMHSLFHVFVLLGSLSHFAAIYQYAIDL
ncbi:MAG: hemolysin III family protein [Eubacteriales bacterium]|jgi:hemolysin III|nr:hemolysin III family protein [Eubacteriales bacterium]